MEGEERCQAQSRSGCRVSSLDFRDSDFRVRVGLGD